MTAPTPPNSRRFLDTSVLNSSRVRRWAPFGAAVLALLLALVVPQPHERLAQLTTAAPLPAPSTTIPLPASAAAPTAPVNPPRPPTAPAAPPATPPTSAAPVTNPQLVSPPLGLTPGEDAPAPVACDAQAAVTALDQALKTADDGLGGIIPSNNLGTLIAIAAKCSDADPTLTLVGLLNELGQGLPDLGLPGLPALAPIALPQGLLDLLAPLGVITAPACAQLGTAGTVLLLMSGNYPEPLASTFSNAAFQALAPCNQLHPPG